jgi:hypothetical protein
MKNIFVRPKTEGTKSRPSCGIFLLASGSREAKIDTVHTAEALPCHFHARNLYLGRVPSIINVVCFGVSNGESVLCCSAVLSPGRRLDLETGHTQLGYSWQL